MFVLPYLPLLIADFFRDNSMTPTLGITPRRKTSRRKINARETYSNYLRADDGRSFGEHIGFDLPRTESRCGPTHREFQMRSSRGIGEWKRTKSAAKASYKIAIALERDRRNSGQSYFREAL